MSSVLRMTKLLTSAAAVREEDTESERGNIFYFQRFLVGEHLCFEPLKSTEAAPRPQPPRSSSVF
jgi:hypothetical protein